MIKAKILYIARGGLVSGSQRQLLNLLARLDRNQFEPFVVCSEGGEFADKVADLEIETRIYPSFFGWRKMRYFFRRYQLCSSLLRQLSGRDIQLIHCSYQWYAPYCFYLSRHLKCPNLVHVRCPVKQSTVRHYRFNYADHLIAISPHIHKNLINAGVCPDKVSLVYDSIDTDVFRPLPPSCRRLNQNGQFVFGLVGRIEPGKYQLAFLHAARILASRHNNVKFVLVGQVNHDEYAQKVKQLMKDFDLCDRVIMYGRCEQMPNLLSEIDVLVSLSGGSVMYEAMACGVPVLSAGFTHPMNAAHVIHDHNAVRLDSRSPEDVASAMETMLENTEYTRKLAANTRPHILSHLNDRAMATQTQSIYERLLCPEFLNRK